MTFGPSSKCAGDQYVGEKKNGKKNGHGTYIFVDSEGEQTVTVSGRLRVNSMEAAAQAVRDGLGIGVLSDYAVHEQLASGEVRRRLDRVRHQGRRDIRFVPTSAPPLGEGPRIYRLFVG